MKKILFLIIVLISFTYSEAQEKFMLYRTKGKLPAMSFSLGTDRLGSAKMNFIDTNVLVKIIDSVQNFFFI